MDPRGADADRHRSQADLHISPASRDKAVGASEVSEGHRGMRCRCGGGKGLWLTEMIPWGREGWWGSHVMMLVAGWVPRGTHP